MSLPGGGAAIAMENLDIGGGLSTHAAALGDQLARSALFHPSPLLRLLFNGKDIENWIKIVD